MVLKQNLDVMTLVELDTYDVVAKILRELGYDGTFQQKTGIVGKEQAGRKRWIRRDGAAIFWLREKFNAVTPKCYCIEQEVQPVYSTEKINKVTGLARLNPKDPEKL